MNPVDFGVHVVASVHGPRMVPGAVVAEGGDRLMINSVSIKLVHAALPGSDVLPGMVIRTGLFY